MSFGFLALVLDSYFIQVPWAWISPAEADPFLTRVYFLELGNNFNTDGNPYEAVAFQVRVVLPDTF